MGFNYNEFFTIFKVKMEKAVKCTVGRYVTQKQTGFPYVDVALSDVSGGAYDLQGNEGITSLMLTITTYSTGSLADNTCQEISQKAKDIMISYGFQCRSGPIPVTNAPDVNIKRWVARYQRVFGSGDELKQLH